jgi:hypothetical protein
MSPERRVDTNRAVGSTTISVDGCPLTRAMSVSAVRTPRDRVARVDHRLTDGLQVDQPGHGLPVERE